MILVKVPRFLSFSTEQFEENVSKCSTTQVRSNGKISNARIIKYKDGSCFLKVGDRMYFLKVMGVGTPTYLAERCPSDNKNEMANKFRIVCSVNTKAFINEVKLKKEQLGP